jgi:hypothetical protein
VSALANSEHSNKARQSRGGPVSAEERRCSKNCMQLIDEQTYEIAHEVPALAFFIRRPATAFAAGDLPLCQRPVPRPCEDDGILPRPSRESRCQRKQLGQVTLSSLLSAGLASESPCAFFLSELLSEIFFCFFVNDRTANRRSHLHLWSCSTRSDVEDKAGSTIEVRLNSSESIINAICSHTRGSFSIW